MNSTPKPIHPPGVNAPHDTANTIDGQETVGGGPPGMAAGDFDIARQVFAERFDHLAELGVGGMGRVLKAFDRRMHRTVAIKRLKTPGTVENDLLPRLVREARLAGQLNHPSVMTVHDILMDDEGPYLVLEFIDGESLADRLERGPIPWAEAIALLLPICDAVTVAHGQGIIHRDIKPANIMLPKKGQPKLGDFGIARSLEGQGLTLTGAALGTLDYVAPEQMTSAKTADERADVYSLAATLYHMVTGETPRPISADELPVELRAIILKSLHRRPENRPASVVEFAQGLKAPPVERTPTSVPLVKEPEASAPGAASDDRLRALTLPAQPTLTGLAAQVAQAATHAAQHHQQAQQALAEFHYAAAAELLERIPFKLRNQQQWRDVVAKRDRLIELEATIGQLVSEHEYRKLASPVQAALELQPNRSDLKSLQALLPDIRLREPEASAPGGLRTVIDLHDIEIPFRWCPPGKFKMGSPPSEAERQDRENQVHVELTHGFWLGETVVTQELFRAILNADPSHFKGPQRPVETVSWEEAQAFCQKLTQQLRDEGSLAPDWRVCLPTEAQWEYACRAGTTTAYFFGNDAARLGQFAWFDENSGKETHPVGTREANPWGLRDMSGNVWEWCEDVYADKLLGGRDPLNASTGDYRVLRGGSWVSYARYTRSASRNWGTPDNRGNTTGFRVCFALRTP